MKKMMVLMLCVTLLCSLTITGFAAKQTLTMTDVDIQPGETVYVTVMLNEAIMGDSIGISYSYDSKHLTAVPDASTWSVEGVLQNFNRKNAGVWATSSPINLKGNVCVLAFEVDPDADFTETTVSCTVMVKNGASDVGTYTAEAVVAEVCDHEYGQWSSAGAAGHSRTCENCKSTQTESHTWDDGKLTDKPNDPNYDLMVYTCTVCGGTKQTEVPADSSTVPAETTIPTEPEPTKPDKVETTFPTKPTEAPTQPTLPDITKPTEPKQPEKPGNTNSDQTNPTNPTKPQNDTPQETTAPGYTDYNQSGEANTQNGTTVPGSENADDHSGHSHTDAEEHPIAVPVNPEGDTAAAEEHDHTHSEVLTEIPAEEQNSPAATIIAVAATVVILIVLAVWGYKKKRKH